MNIVRELRDVKRLNHILNVLFRHQFGYFIKDLNLKKHLSFKNKISGEHERHSQEAAAKRLREAFESLGPTFVKLGQLLSLRSDLIPDEFCTEFKKLQNHVPPIPYSEIKTIVENELGRSIKNVFRKFDEEPIAAASVAQVHKAVLRNGKKVAVKVQRPGIKELMEEDIDIMYFVARKMEKHDYYSKINPVSIVDEFKMYTENELDFLHEAKNCAKFRRNFEKSNEVYFPKPYIKHSTKKVLVTEFIDGICLSDAQKIKEKHVKCDVIVRNGMKALFKQIFVDGFFHADSHPSNMFVLKDKKIAYVDFGIVGSIDDELKMNFLKFIYALNEKDVDMMVKYVLAVGEPPRKLDKFKYRNDVKDIIDEWDGKLSSLRPTIVLYRIINTSISHNIKIPGHVILVVKALMTIEGTGCEIYPSFDLVKESRPVIQKILRKYMTPQRMFNKAHHRADHLMELATTLPDKAESLLDKIEQGELKLSVNKDDIAALTNQDRSNNNKRNATIIVAAMLIGSSLLLQAESQPLLLGMPLATVGFTISMIISVYLLIRR